MDTHIDIIIKLKYQLLIEKYNTILLFPGQN